MHTGFDLLGALPLELSAQCLAQLPCRERYAVVPLVSKRWRDLTHSPALLRQLAIELRKTNALPALLRSLSAGLLRRAAGHVASLRLALDASCTYQTGVATTPGTAVFEEVAPSAGAGAEAEDGLHAVQAGLACCLAACDAPGPRSLSSLVLDLDYLPLCLADPWATGALRNLRQLSVRTFGAPLSVSAPLHTLDRLAELSLDGAPLALGEAARLPAGLTRLHLAGVQDAGVFGKVAEATALRSLSLARMEHSAEELSRLSGLGPGLQRLAVSWCSHLPAPATLAQLSGLRALHIDHTPRRGHAQEVCAELQAALEPLTRLTHLVCAHLRAAASMPPALADLADLQSFGWHGPAPTASPALPDGPWVRSLRTVAVPAEVAAASLPLLAGATRLEGLGLSRFAAGGCARQYGILRTAAAHPTLRRVCLHLRDAPLAVGWFDAAVEAQRRKPGLSIERSNSIAEALAGHEVEA